MAPPTGRRPGPAKRRLPSLALLLAAVGTASAADEELLVMLQDSRLPEIRRAVAGVGGVITHDLPIISAVGARLSRDQLDAITEQLPDLTRVIDDLAWTPEPDPPADDECTLAGAIQLAWSGAEARWTLYNKGAAPLELTRVEIAVPAGLPRIQTATLDTTILGPAAPDTPADSVAWHQEAGVTLAPGGSEDLRIVFTDAPANPPALQRALALSAGTDETCETTLVDTYDAPAQDSYYPTVTGAATLQSHGVTGAGIGVAVLDSGLWEESDEIRLDTRGEARVLARYDAILGTEVTEAVDESGHGTHMASVIARSGRTTRTGTAQPSYKGIAPDAGLVAVKAFGSSGEAGFLDIVRGIQWIVERREDFNIRVLNLSFASRPRWPYWEDPVNQALMRAWADGLFIVASAGNEGPEPMTGGAPGNLPYLLTVGATTDAWTESDRTDDYIPDFSSRGPTPLGHIKPDVVAPGGHIAGLTPADSTLAREFPEYFLDTGEFVMTGSSQSAAIVSGLAALLLQLEPGLTNDELKCLITTSAEPAIEPDGRLSYSPFAQGAGLVSAARALTLGVKQCEQQSLNLAADMRGDDHFVGPAVFSEDHPPRLPDQETLIAEPSAEGPNGTRRWGAAEHLQRLPSPDAASPIDWLGVYAEEQARMRDLAEQ